MSRFPCSATLAIASLLCLPAAAQSDFVNWETPHVTPLALSADGAQLYAVNTADNRLEIFDVTSGIPERSGSVPVGLDPVSVRVRAADEVWVVNHISDSVSVVQPSTQSVLTTLSTADEPCDVVFAGAPARAFVSCSQANLIQVFDPANLSAAPIDVAIQGEDPRALAVSPDGSRVFAAIFESGNKSTVLGGGIDDSVTVAFPPNVVSDPSGPYGGQNPPPNVGTNFVPPINPALTTPPKVGLIVKQNTAGQWMDDNGGDWTDLVTGPNADKSGRKTGWHLVDHDVAIIDSSSLQVSYATGLMNLCMALAVHPISGDVTVIGTDATNEIRFEPQITGTFLRVLFGRAAPGGGAALAVRDLNEHLDYQSHSLPQAQRELSLGDPRALVWDPGGTRGYVAGMGSNNVIVIDAMGARSGLSATIEVGEGPTGLALAPAADRLFVLNKFDASISTVELTSETEIARTPFHDPTPGAIRTGRVHLYGTHENSGLGQIACASCHADSRLDRLAWDLGDPSGDLVAIADQNRGANIPGLNSGFKKIHPMKGPMTTQTLQDIIGKEPLHWRGDRDGIEEFGPAFDGLQGADAPLMGAPMQEFEDFLASIHFPPNPFRNVDNSLPDDLPLDGHFTTGRFAPEGQPLPNGDATRGLALFRPPNFLDAGALACNTCHTMPTGMGTNTTLVGGTYQPFPTGPNGEAHHMLVSVDGSTNITMKVPQLRNEYEKTGFNFTQLANTVGFGILHDGSVDSIERFIGVPAFDVQSDQDIADLTALMLAFSGSDLPSGSPTTLFQPPGTASQDAHAAVGLQVTLVDALTAPVNDMALLTQLIGLAEAGEIGLVVKGQFGGLSRGFVFQQATLNFQSDRAAEVYSGAEVRAAAQPGAELTFTAVPSGSELRIGIDRDRDGFFDRDEIDAGSDPANAASTPGGCCNLLMPAAPTGLTLALTSSTTSTSDFQLDWSDVATTESGYRVERAVLGGGFTQVASLPPNATTFADPGLACGSTYQWRVSAENCAGNSGFALASMASADCCPTPQNYCVSAVNSVGTSAVIGWAGSTSVSAADFTLNVSAAVPAQMGLFFYGAGQQQTPFGDGSLCITAGGIDTFRFLPGITLDASGGFTLPVDFTQPPAGSGPGSLTVGSNWNFQFWYRDPAAGLSGFNLSDALSATFCP